MPQVQPDPIDLSALQAQYALRIQRLTAHDGPGANGAFQAIAVQSRNAVRGAGFDPDLFCIDTNTWQIVNAITGVPA